MRRAGRFGRLNRREALAGGFCLCCLPSTLCAQTFAVEEIAPAIYMRRGVDEEASFRNLDAIANIGFIVGEDAVLVTETGGSLADGHWLRKAIRQKTDKPIKYVVLSHVHPDHAFGAAAFLEDAPIFIGHRRLGELLGSRGEFYRKRLIDLLGEANVGAIVMPTRVVTTREEIDLGGRVIGLEAHGPAHTVTDLSLWDKNSGLFLPADLLFVGRAPALDGSLTGWIAELEAMQAQGYGRTCRAMDPRLSTSARRLTICSNI